MAGRPSTPPSAPLRALGLALATLLVCAAAAGGSPDEEYLAAARTILCDCGCHPQSVHECACGRAAEMRDEIRALVEREGLTGEAVVARYVAAHGEKIRIAPTARGFNLVAWVGPFVALAAAAAGLLLWLRRAHRATPAAAGGPPLPAGLDAAYLERLRRELRDAE